MGIRAVSSFLPGFDMVSHAMLLVSRIQRGLGWIREGAWFCEAGKSRRGGGGLRTVCLQRGHAHVVHPQEHKHGGGGGRLVAAKLVAQARAAHTDDHETHDGTEGEDRDAETQRPLQHRTDERGERTRTTKTKQPWSISCLSPAVGQARPGPLLPRGDVRGLIELIGKMMGLGSCQHPTDKALEGVHTDGTARHGTARTAGTTKAPPGLFATMSALPTKSMARTLALQTGVAPSISHCTAAMSHGRPAQRRNANSAAAGK